MPKHPRAVDDPTPLTASRIHVPVRIGWLLRTHRTAAGLSLRQMSTELTDRGVSLSSSSLGRVEAEGQRSAAALDGYAEVLGLPDGSLRAPVAMLCRTFRYAPPESREPRDLGRTGLDRFSAVCDAVDVDAPTGGAWLRFAREHADPPGFGLPIRIMEPHLVRLVAELSVSVGTGMLPRHEALSSLRCGAYGNLVEEVARAEVLAPGHPAVNLQFSILSDLPTPSLLRWLSDTLSQDRKSVV